MHRNQNLEDNARIEKTLQPWPDTSQLRIVVISDALKDRNGVDTYYRDLVSHLKPYVSCIRHMSPNPEDGELFSRLSVPMPGDATQQLVFPHATRLYSEVKSIQPHIIVAATNGPFGLFSLYAAYRLRAQLVAGFHTLIEDLCKMYWGHGVIGGMAHGYMEFQNWLIFKCAKSVAVNSKSMIHSAKSLSDTPVTLMGTPLDHRFIDKPISERGPFLQRILYAGRLAPEKNLESLIACAAAQPDLQFTIAGDGPLRGSIELKASELPNLTFVGHLQRDKIVDAIDDHDLLVLPSHLEAFGTIALEAMVRQRLVLVSSHCGILSWEFLAKGLYKFEPEESLCSAIASIRNTDLELRNSKAKIARESALEAHRKALFDWLTLFSELAHE